MNRILNKVAYFIIPSEENNFRSIILQSRAFLLCAAILLAVRVILVFGPLNFPQNIFFADITKSALENYTNQARQSAGLSPLSNNAKLEYAAQMKAQNMIENQYFSHTSPSGITPWHWFSQAGYKYKYAGENLAIGFYESEEVYNAWLNSPSHRDNILNPNYTEIGIAVLTGYDQGGTVVVVQEFGSPAPKAQPAATQAPKTEADAPKQESLLQETENTEQIETPAVEEERVLSGSDTAPYLRLDSGEKKASGNLAKILSFVLYDYNAMIQEAIYIFSAVLIFILMILIIFNYRIKFKRELVFRVVLIAIVLSGALLLDKNAIISAIPHTVII